MTLKNQIVINEEIRDAYSFMKQTERIQSEAPWAYSEAKLKWFNKVIEGLNLVTSNEDILGIYDKMVTIDTQMKHTTYKAICSQGPTIREKYLFPWE